MIADAFADALADRRSQLNLQVAEARRRYPAFDPASFADFLQSSVDPLVRAVAAFDAGRVPRVVLAAFEAALELSAHSLVGPQARSAGVGQVWRTLAPQFARHIALAPTEVLGLLSNAILCIEKSGTARPAQWIAEMARCAPQVESLAQVHALGQLLAWRAGLAHFRHGALSASMALPASLVAALFGLDADAWPVARAAMLADPWWGTAPGFEGVEIGAFSGFGGEFLKPPQVRACVDGFIVESAARYFLLVADMHGAILLSANAGEFAAAAQISWQAPGPLPAGVDLPPGQLTVTGNAHTLAVTSAWTHAIRLLPRP